MPSTRVSTSQQHAAPHRHRHRYYQIGMQRIIKFLITSTTVILLVVLLFVLISISKETSETSKLNKLMDTATEKIRYTFPKDFMWGTATASYQIEGSTTTHREKSIWDDFSSIPGNTLNGDSGEPACDHYNRYEQDVDELIKPLNTKYYRFSIAWPRIKDDKNRKDGIRFYSSLIKKLIENGIEPVVTLYHWDLPSTLLKYLSSKHPDDIQFLMNEFNEYAKICFTEFGHSVKYWITLNEPWCSSFLGYEIGEHAPGLKNNPGIDLYQVAHNLILSHAKIVETYRTEFKATQHGQIGITLNAMWFQPFDPTDETCINATKTAIQFELGWFAHPIFHESADYPTEMRHAITHDRLPTFTAEQKKLIQYSSDFFGLNHYSTAYVKGFKTTVNNSNEPPSYDQDKAVETYHDPNWEVSDMGWAIVPWGLQKLLQYIQKTYNPKGGILVTENGLAVSEPTVEEAVQLATSQKRIAFYQNYLLSLHNAINGVKINHIVGDGLGLEGIKVNVKGYFLWSLMDNFEWALGYTKRFGIYYVDYKTMKRTAKPAVQWYANVVNDNSLGIDIVSSSFVRKNDEAQ